MLASIFHCKENDGTIGAALLHQILLETGRQPGGNHSEDSDKRGHGSNDSRAKLHSERGFFGMLPTMASPLGEVCGVPRELL